MVVKGGYWDAHELTLHLGHLSAWRDKRLLFNMKIEQQNIRQEGQRQLKRSSGTIPARLPTGSH